MYNEARKIDGHSTKAAVHVADLFFKSKRYAEAAQNYVAAGAQDLEFPELFLKAARSFRKAGKHKEAQEMYAKEVELRPSVLSTFLEAAEFFLEQNAPDQVPKLFRRFGNNFSSDHRVLIRLSQAYFAMNDTAKAREHAEMAMKLSPIEAEPYRILGSIYESQGQYQLSKKNYEQYLLILPQAPESAQLKLKLSMPPFSTY